jgi:hypothetical protein
MSHSAESRSVRRMSHLPGVLIGSRTSSTVNTSRRLSLLPTVLLNAAKVEDEAPGTDKLVVLPKEKDGDQEFEMLMLDG